MSAAKEATAELLRQLGVQLTNAGLQSLNSTANTAQVKAETALAKGIEAQRQGTTVEALSYYIQASNYNSGLAEAVSRMNILNASISSGNIGQDTRNEIAWRRQWVTRLQETETFFANAIREPQPFYIVYSTDIRRGKIDWQKETIDLTIRMGFYPDYVWAQNINEVIEAVKRGLQSTGRAQAWEIDWPAKSIGSPSPFAAQTKNSTSTVVVEIINSEGKSIGRQTVKSSYGFESRGAAITPAWQWEGDVVFTGVDANLITDKLTIRVASIDGAAAETAARQKNISVMPEAEWESILKMLPSTRQKIELAQQRQRADDLRKQADEQLKNENTYGAISNYTEAIRLKPDDAMAYNGRANAYLKNKNYNAAISDWEYALRLNSNLTEARRNIDNARQQQQKEQEQQRREQEQRAQAAVQATYDQGIIY
jgi:tetratricopeptide (TPR) repeat protein